MHTLIMHSFFKFSYMQSTILKMQMVAFRYCRQTLNKVLSARDVPDPDTGKI